MAIVLSQSMNELTANLTHDDATWGAVQIQGDEGRGGTLYAGHGDMSPGGIT